MKKIRKILLSLLLLVSMSSISQNATAKKVYPAVTTTENKVVIDTTVAHLIANDLVSGDVCKAELKLVRSNLALTKKEVVLKDSIISNMEKQKDDLIKIISKKEEMFSKQEEISNTYKKSLSKQKRTTFIYKALSLLGVVSTTLLIIK